MKESDKRWGVSRRSFLKGTGAVAAASALQSETAEAAQQGSRVVAGATAFKLNVNGTEHEVTAEPRSTLLDVLRYQLDMTGAKPVSGDGSSGASTVLVDGKPMMASTMLAIACRGKKIETPEAVTPDQPDAVCRAFQDQDAQQCGFCTPGFVVAVRAFLKRNPQATVDQIREGLNGNICRCGTYANVLQAVTALVKGGTNG